MINKRVFDKYQILLMIIMQFFYFHYTSSLVFFAKDVVLVFLKAVSAGLSQLTSFVVGFQ